MGAMKNLAVKRAMSKSKIRIHPSLELDAPPCPYCNKRLDGPMINGLHESCNIRLHEELEKWEHEHPLFVME